MWPFKQRVNKDDEDYNSCVEFRKIGETFNYLGVEMIVTDHRRIEMFTFSSDMEIPCIVADYIDNNGHVKNIVFPPRKLEVLRKQNPSRQE